MPIPTSAAAWALRRVVAGVVIGSVVVTVGIVGDARAVGEPPASSTWAVSIAARPALPLQTGWRRDMLAQVNAIRAAAGVRPLRPCAALRRSAQGTPR
jgi:hypothetical protein